MSAFRIDARTTEVVDCESIFGEVVRLTKPRLLEILAPSDPDAWEGIWATHGFDDQPVLTCS